MNVCGLDYKLIAFNVSYGLVVFSEDALPLAVGAFGDVMDIPEISEFYPL